MRPFRFGLERVLTWQSKLCRAQEELLRNAADAVIQTETRIADLSATGFKVEHETLIQRSLTAADAAALGQDRARRRRERRSLDDQKHAELAALDTERARLSALRQRLRVVEKLRERSLQQHRDYIEKELTETSLESHLGRVASARAGGVVAFDEAAQSNHKFLKKIIE